MALEDALGALEQWHDEDSGHGMAFRFCYREPCYSVRDAAAIIWEDDDAEVG